MNDINFGDYLSSNKDYALLLNLNHIKLVNIIIVKSIYHSFLQKTKKDPIKLILNNLKNFSRNWILKENTKEILVAF